MLIAHAADASLTTALILKDASVPAVAMHRIQQHCSSSAALIMIRLPDVISDDASHVLLFSALTCHLYITTKFSILNLVPMQVYIQLYLGTAVQL
jgi:hypothetical protein